ncbi:NfeD family protein [Carboxylicivirga mesophila]|uniref:NfeD family protein n=1 Tax=Carboxylicivirga mesophila TaxID=1166478 RepID=A0ABS5KD92_9BACT|nr:NfeD family protein [Carboxylicivirga mesophila]MBS2212983.1 NfeD family protein [Carboxylicivirga mesophila]
MEILSNEAVIWFIAGAALLLLEFVIPGVFILFFGIGAWVTALCVYLFEPSLAMQFLIFSSTSVLSLILLRSFLLKKLYKMPDPVVDPDEEFIGGVGECIVDIRPDADGKVEFKGTSWTASAGTEINPGTKVRIIRKVGLLLEVEPA